MLALQEVFLDTYHFEREWLSQKAYILSVFSLGGCGGLERPLFFTIFALGGCGGLVRTDLT